VEKLPVDVLCVIAVCLMWSLMRPCDVCSLFRMEVLLQTALTAQLLEHRS
jgi:hypothetical protein